jgi:hypothetical protein
MPYVLLIVETPVSEGTLEFEVFFHSLRALSDLGKQNKGCQLLTGNVLQIPIDTELDTLFAVIEILRKNRGEGGVRYKMQVLIEPLKLHDQGSKEV